MKKNIIKTLIIIAISSFAWACTPDRYSDMDISAVDLSKISKIEILPNQRMVIADGNATLDLLPRMYTDNNLLIPDSRIKPEWLEYKIDGKVTNNRFFTTSDASLIGKTLTATVKLKGSNIESESVSFKVVAPLDKKYSSEITIPVVFHIIQTSEEIELYQGKIEKDRIDLILKKLNNVFGGLGSVNPVGVNTNVKFRYAEYNLHGETMPEKGINRLVVKKINPDDNYSTFLHANNLVWPAQKYMNIWLISDLKKDYEYFGYDISNNCKPRYKAKQVEDNMPEGLSLKEYSDDVVFGIEQSGIVYKLQELDVMNRRYGDEMTNELIYYVGRYLGLKSTCHYWDEGEDYCDDTIDYWEINGFDNTGWYKFMEGCYFLAENIMDDQRGVHNSISKNQCERLRWVLNNCPDRAAWKSDFAFKGK